MKDWIKLILLVLGIMIGTVLAAPLIAKLLSIYSKWADRLLS